MTFNISPSVKVTEHDFSLTSQQIETTLTGYVAHSTRGEAYTVKTITNENDLVTFLNKPTDSNYDTWFPAFKFLDYASSLRLVRAIIRKEGLLDGITGQRIAGTEPTINAQLGLFRNDGREYPSVFAELQLQNNLTTNVLVGETFTIPDYLYLDEYFANYMKGDATNRSISTVTKAFINYKKNGAIVTASVVNKTYQYAYGDLTVDETSLTSIFNGRMSPDQRSLMLFQNGILSPKDSFFQNVASFNGVASGQPVIGYVSINGIGTSIPVSAKTNHLKMLDQTGAIKGITLFQPSTQGTGTYALGLGTGKIVEVKGTATLPNIGDTMFLMRDDGQLDVGGPNADPNGPANPGVESDIWKKKNIFGVVLNAVTSGGFNYAKLLIVQDVDSQYATPAAWTINGTYTPFYEFVAESNLPTTPNTVVAATVPNGFTLQFGAFAGVYNPASEIFYSIFSSDLAGASELKDFQSWTSSISSMSKVPVDFGVGVGGAKFVWNFSPALTGYFEDIENSISIFNQPINPNTMEIRVLTPNTPSKNPNGSVNNQIINRYDWFTYPPPQNPLTTPTLNAPNDFNLQLLEGTLNGFGEKIILADFIVALPGFNFWNFAGDSVAYVLSGGEYVPIFPRYADDFPYVEEQIIDPLTSLTTYIEDPLHSQEKQIYNFDDFKLKRDGFMFEPTNELVRFVSRWPGSEGNRMYVATVGKVNFQFATIFEGTLFRDIFEFPPRAYDEICVAVLFDDSSGAGLQIVEKYYVSLKYGKRDSLNQSMWIEDVINEQSAYIYAVANQTLLGGIQEFFIDPNTKAINPLIDPNLGLMPYELSTITQFFNRYTGLNVVLPNPIDVPDYLQPTDIKGNPLLDVNGNPVPSAVLSYICDSKGKSVFRQTTGYSLPGPFIFIVKPNDPNNIYFSKTGSWTVTSIKFNRNGDLVLVGTSAINGILIPQEFYALPNQKFGLGVGQWTFSNFTNFGGVGTTLVVTPPLADSYLYIDNTVYNPVTDTVVVGVNTLTGPYHSNENLKGWIKEIHGFFPDINLINNNIPHLFTGTDGINREGVPGRPTNADVAFGYDLFNDPEELDISILISGGWSNQTIATYIQGIVERRRDCIGIINTPRTTVFGKKKAQATSDSVKFRNDIISGYGGISSTYLFLISQLGFIFDKFNDKFRWIDLTGDIAGLAAFVDGQFDPWFTFAGFKRGLLRNIIRLSYNPNEALRDELTKAQINAIFTSPGDGTVLFHEKMMTTQNTVFSECHIRRLFIVIEKTIASQAKFFLFDFNDPFTRTQFLMIVEPFLNSIKSRRGIEAFLAICNESNNGPDVRNAREMFCDLFITPSGAIYHIGLNVFATKSGVNFSEIQLNQ